jgi:hypothetical protein
VLKALRQCAIVLKHPERHYPMLPHLPTAADTSNPAQQSFRAAAARAAATAIGKEKEREHLAIPSRLSDPSPQPLAAGSQDESSRQQGWGGGAEAGVQGYAVPQQQPTAQPWRHSAGLQAVEEAGAQPGPVQGRGEGMQLPTSKRAQGLASELQGPGGEATGGSSRQDGDGSFDPLSRGPAHMQPQQAINQCDATSGTAGPALLLLPVAHNQCRVVSSNRSIRGMRMPSAVMMMTTSTAGQRGRKGRDGRQGSLIHSTDPAPPEHQVQPPLSPVPSLMEVSACLMHQHLHSQPAHPE